MRYVVKPVIGCLSQLGIEEYADSLAAVSYTHLDVYKRQHIDQAQSMNLYITNDYSMRQVLRLYLEAWRAGVKTIY